MTALSLSQIVADGLARIGIDPSRDNIPKGRPRVTTWFGSEHGFGVRHYAGGRQVYIAQTRMGGRLRTVTIGRWTDRQTAINASSDMARNASMSALKSRQ